MVEKKPIAQHRQMQFIRRSGILEDDSDQRMEEMKPTTKPRQMQFSRRAELVHQGKTTKLLSL